MFSNLVDMSQAQAQGAIFVSNLAQPSAGSRSVARNAWWAQGFQTGNNLNGYLLNSVQLRMNAPFGSASGFDVSLFSWAGGYPSAELAVLNGPDPLIADTYSYATTGVPLQPDSFYFVVVSAETPAASGSFSWSYAGNSLADSIDGWRYGPYTSYSNDGLNWTRTTWDFQFSINATVVPEPSSLAVFLTAGIIAANHFRRPRKRQ